MSALSFQTAVAPVVAQPAASLASVIRRARPRPRRAVAYPSRFDWVQEQTAVIDAKVQAFLAQREEAMAAMLPPPAPDPFRAFMPERTPPLHRLCREGRRMLRLAC